MKKTLDYLGAKAGLVIIDEPSLTMDRPPPKDRDGIEAWILESLKPFSRQQVNPRTMAEIKGTVERDLKILADRFGFDGLPSVREMLARFDFETGERDPKTLERIHIDGNGERINRPGNYLDTPVRRIETIGEGVEIPVSCIPRRGPIQWDDGAMIYMTPNLIDLAKALERVVKRVTLGYSFPVRVRGAQVKRAGDNCLNLDLSIEVREAATGKATSVVHSRFFTMPESGTVTEEDDPNLARDVIDMLFEVVRHEAAEGIMYDDKKIEDPHP